jgi:hypothetical protein
MTGAGAPQGPHASPGRWTGALSGAGHHEDRVGGEAQPQAEQNSPGRELLGCQPSSDPEQLDDDIEQDPAAKSRDAVVRVSLTRLRPTSVPTNVGRRRWPARVRGGPSYGHKVRLARSASLPPKCWETHFPHEGGRGRWPRGGEARPSCRCPGGDADSALPRTSARS